MIAAAAIHTGLSPLLLEELPEDYLDTILHLLFVERILSSTK